ncbi:MAG: thiamine diphosphokinase [Neomegalonema sp.]|nr:thiamine diphosphokinase [Neomegalonema sp.]
MTSRLHYNQPVILIGGGALDADALALARQFASPLIAADSGADKVPTEQLDALIGDMDSVSDLAAYKQVNDLRVLHLSEQETTDFEKCLYSVEAPLYLACGFLGRRFDHALAALHALLRHEDRRVVLIGEEEVAFLAPAHWTISLEIGARISLVPLRPVRAVRSQGWRWPLDGLGFALGVQSGTSNQASAATVSADFDRVGMLVLIERRFLAQALESLGLKKHAVNSLGAAGDE